jgi:ankyrin repeat protein
MVSKTAMLELVKGFRAGDVDKALKDDPDLLKIRDERGRNLLHILCMRKPAKGKAADSIKTAEVLLKHGVDKDSVAFTEGNWKATPLWHAVGRGQNLALAEFLLKRGCNPNYSLWAASFNNDRDAIRLLVRHGALLEDSSVDESPFLGAVKWSRFGPAEELLKLGANPDYRDKHGMTALHYMLKKNTDKKQIAMVIAHGARGDIKDRQGRTVIDILTRKKDAALRKMAEQLANRGSA